MPFQDQLQLNSTLFLRQQTELGEFVGFETRNKYSIETEQSDKIGFAAEQQKGVFGFLARQALGHWRSFDLLFFDKQRQPVMRAVHPFRIIFQRMEVFSQDGQRVGAVQQRFSILSKKFDVLDQTGNISMSVSSPIYRIWTFPFLRNGQELAKVTKKWSGTFKEALTDADNFEVKFNSAELSLAERMLVLAAAVFIDLKYFERKARD